MNLLPCAFFQLWLGHSVSWSLHVSDFAVLPVAPIRCYARGLPFSVACSATDKIYVTATSGITLFNYIIITICKQLRKSDERKQLKVCDFYVIDVEVQVPVSSISVANCFMSILLYWRWQKLQRWNWKVKRRCQVLVLLWEMRNPDAQLS